MKWSEMSFTGKVCCVLMFVALIGSVILMALGLFGIVKDGTRFGAMLFCYALGYVGVVFYRNDKKMKTLLLVLACVTFLLNAAMLLV